MIYRKDIFHIYTQILIIDSAKMLRADIHRRAGILSPTVVFLCFTSLDLKKRDDMSNLSEQEIFN